MKHTFYLVALGLIFTVSACGGGGGGSSGGTASTSIEGLEIGDSISIVTETSSGSASLVKALKTGISKLAPSGGDYINDLAEVESSIYDPSLEAFSMIKEILCFIKQTAYDQMTNQGPYKALVNASVCEGEHESKADESSNQSSAGSNSQKETETWYVDSTRECETCDHEVSAWVDLLDQEGIIIEAKLTVSEAASATNPWGIFHIDFVESDEFGPVFQGYLGVSLEGGLYNVVMKMSDSLENFVEEVHAELVPGSDNPTNQGKAYIHRKGSDGMGGGEEGSETATSDESEGFSFEETVRISFDQSHYLAQFNGGEYSTCVDRNDFIDNVWRYNLYDQAGARVTRNSGFPIKCGREDWDFGWFGYYGLWCPDHLGIGHGSTVTSEDEVTSYTVFKAPGRLIKKTRQELNIRDLDGLTYERWDGDNNMSFIIRIDIEGDTVTLVKSGTSECGEGGCTITPLSPEVPIDLNSFEWGGGWREGYGGIDFVADENGDIPIDTVVANYVEEYVRPDDTAFANGALELKGYEQCLRPQVSTDDWNAGNVSENRDIDDPCLCTIDPSDMTLVCDGAAVGPVSCDGIGEEGPNSWGARSGPLFTRDTQINETWEGWSQENFYEYEVGCEDWNHYTTLLDETGKSVSVDRPLYCLYTHDDGGVYKLDYNGIGELHGIPHEQLEVNEHEDFDMWVPVLTIADGTELDCEGAPYYTRAMTVEKFMQTLPEADCASLDIDLDLSGPTDAFVDPGLGAIPTTAVEPAVVEGVVQ